jgi:hypothetical protein
LVETGITTFLQCTFTESYNNLLCTIMVKTVQGWFFSLDEHLVEQKQQPQVLFVHAPMPLSVQNVHTTFIYGYIIPMMKILYIKCHEPWDHLQLGHLFSWDGTSCPLVEALSHMWTCWHQCRGRALSLHWHIHHCMESRPVVVGVHNCHQCWGWSSPWFLCKDDACVRGGQAVCR